MKLALIYEKFISRGGLENYLYSFASQLVEDGHNLEIITRETDVVTAELKRANFHRIPRKSLRQFSEAAQSAVAGLEVDVSIGFGRTVAHDLHRAGGGCHRFFSDHVLHPLKRVSAKNRSELALERELYTSGKTRHFVVNSEMVAEQLMEAYGLESDQISVIHTAVDVGRFRPAGSRAEKLQIRRELEPGTDAGGGGPVFLFVSMNHRRKGLDALLRAWPDAPADAQLWIVGPELAPRYRKLIRAAKLGDRVRSIVKPADLLAYYQAADFFVHPTLYDACANTVLQAMACGLPGIISENDGARQFVKDGENGLRLPHPEDPVEIAAKLLQMSELSLEKQAEMAVNARQTALPLTWSAHLGRWMEVIGTKLG